MSDVGMGDASVRVTSSVAIPRTELITRATRSGGPGGQHVNTSSTRIELLWNVVESGALTEAQRARVRAKLGTRMDSDGFLRVVASESRSQRQNRAAAEQRLVELVRRALAVPKRRIPTRPSRAAKEARLAEKRRRGEKKRLRRDDGE
jgi:ribosome-associated protein